MVRLPTLIRWVQKSLSPELLKPKYREDNADNPMYGHCYHASEALYHLLGGKSSGYKPRRARDEFGIVHWWLVDPKGRIVDVTVDQYTCVGLEPPYLSVTPGGFMSRKGDAAEPPPSKTSQEVIRRVKKLEAALRRKRASR